MPKPYDPTGAMGGLFAPAFIHGNPESEAATQAWLAENYGMTNPGVDATRGPSTTVTNPGVGRTGATTTTIPGSVDPEALRALAQGGKYTDTRDQIAAQVLANNAGAEGAAGGAGAGGRSPALSNQPWIDYMRQNYGITPQSPFPMMQGDNSGFMQGQFAGGA